MLQPRLQHGLGRHKEKALSGRGGRRVERSARWELWKGKEKKERETEREREREKETEKQKEKEKEKERKREREKERKREREREKQGAKDSSPNYSCSLL